MPRAIALLLLLLGAAGCALSESPGARLEEAPPLDPSRPIAQRDCSSPIDIPGGNLDCR